MNILNTIRALVAFFTSHPLGVVLIILPLSILAKNLIGAGGSVLQDKFNFDYLKRGLFKGTLIYLGIAVLALIAYLSPDLTVSIGATDYSLVEAIIVLITGAIILYIRDTISILAIIFKQNTTEEN